MGLSHSGGYMKLSEQLSVKCMDLDKVVANHIKRFKLEATEHAEMGSHSCMYYLDEDNRGLAAPLVIEYLEKEGFRVEVTDDLGEISLWVTWFE